MKKKIALLICLAFSTFSGFSQNNQNVINYNISSSSRIVDYSEGSLVSVGGDLVVTNENLCVEKDKRVQNLFDSATSSSFSIDINNRGGGNCCVSLVVETTSGRIIAVIPEDIQSGILKFARVKKAYLTFTKNPRDRAEQIPTAKRTAMVWF